MSNWLEIIYRLKHGLIIFEKFVAASSLLLLLIMAIIQIISRNFFDTGFTHMEVVSRHLILFIIFMGAALVSEQNRHIKIDLLVHFLTPEVHKKLIRPLLLLSSVISGILAWYAILFWQDEWQYAPVNERWSVYLALILPAGFSILSLHLLLLGITHFEPERVVKDETPCPAANCSYTDLK